MSQNLILPINTMQITADYKVEAYRKQYGFGHYGADCIDKSRQNRNVYGMGNGTVVACGMDGTHSKDKLGNCIVIVYRDVKCNDGVVCDLACRMFHFDKILCKVGDVVDSNTVIGTYGSTGKYGNGAHLHIEFDTDIKYPEYAVGIATSGKVVKRGTTDSTINPFAVFWLGDNQSIYAERVDIANGWVKAKSLALIEVYGVTERTYTETEYNLLLAEKDAAVKLADAAERKYRNLLDGIKNLFLE